jgi:hypothetical protein
MSETKTIVRYGLNYGKNYQECLNILEFIRKHSPDTKFELISKSTDKDKLESKVKLLEAALEKCREQRNQYFAFYLRGYPLDDVSKKLRLQRDIKEMDAELEITHKPQTEEKV